jgi:DNA-binding phage protein
MKKAKLPTTDSIEKLAKFWDTHDLSDFDDQLEEVPEPVFVRDSAIKVRLEAQEARAVARLARKEGISSEELIRALVQKAVRRRSAATQQKPGRLRTSNGRGKAHPT